MRCDRMGLKNWCFLALHRILTNAKDDEEMCIWCEIEWMVHMAQCQYTPAYSTHRRIALSFPIKGFRCYCSMFTKLFGFEVSYFFSSYIVVYICFYLYFMYPHLATISREIKWRREKICNPLLSIATAIGIQYTAIKLKHTSLTVASII